ncbi:MAG: RNA-binding S4 domain-containing protein [Chloroflexi bacterium]|jgi:ribosome-associated heat shock protein Hsp15|nr:RNA-binding S4 domain-containing protein [Chloroflexota bacterium]
MSVDGVRIDTWLWAARFFKTRGLANEAVAGGRAHVNGVRVKPSKDVRPGDTIELSIGEVRWTMAVTALADKRGPASLAATLYAEMPDSIARREQQVTERRLVPPPAASVGARPTKQARRRIEAINRRAGRER